MIRWVSASIDRPEDHLDRAAAFWTTVTGSSPQAPPPEVAEESRTTTLQPSAGDPCLALRGVHEGGGGAHLDLEFDDVPKTAGAAGELGATVISSHQDRVVMRSPGGQPFCLRPWDGASSRPPVVTHPDGATSRLDQVCIDIRPAAYDAELAFWTAFTGWEWIPSVRPEFDLVKPADALPVRILLQRLDSDQHTSAHLDIACSDFEAVTVWHEHHGAHLVGRGPFWTVLEDPVGGIYCLTARHPQTGTLPPELLAQLKGSP